MHEPGSIVGSAGECVVSLVIIGVDAAGENNRRSSYGNGVKWMCGCADVADADGC